MQELPSSRAPEEFEMILLPPVTSTAPAGVGSVTIAPSLLTLGELAARLSSPERAVACDPSIRNRTLAVSMKARPWESAIRLVCEVADAEARRMEDGRWLIQSDTRESVDGRRRLRRYADMYARAAVTATAPAWARYLTFPKYDPQNPEVSAALRDALFYDSCGSAEAAKTARLVLRLLDERFMPAFVRLTSGLDVAGLVRAPAISRFTQAALLADTAPDDPRRRWFSTSTTVESLLRSSVPDGSAPLERLRTLSFDTHTVVRLGFDPLDGALAWQRSTVIAFGGGRVSEEYHALAPDLVSPQPSLSEVYSGAPEEGRAFRSRVDATDAALLLPGSRRPFRVAGGAPTLSGAFIAWCSQTDAEGVMEVSAVRDEALPLLGDAPSRETTLRALFFPGGLGSSPGGGEESLPTGGELVARLRRSLQRGRPYGVTREEGALLVRNEYAFLDRAYEDGVQARRLLLDGLGSGRGVRLASALDVAGRIDPKGVSVLFRLGEPTRFGGWVAAYPYLRLIAGMDAPKRDTLLKDVARDGSATIPMSRFDARSIGQLRDELRSWSELSPLGEELTTARTAWSVSLHPSFAAALPSAKLTITRSEGPAREDLVDFRIELPYRDILSPASRSEGGPATLAWCPATLSGVIWNAEKADGGRR